MGIRTHSLKTPLDDCCGDFILQDSGYESSFIFLLVAFQLQIRRGKKRRNILGQTIVAWLNQVAD